MSAILAAFGARPRGTRAERLRQSSHYRDGAFHNTRPTGTLQPEEFRRAMREVLKNRSSRGPAGPIPVITPSPDSAPADSLHLDHDRHGNISIQKNFRGDVHIHAHSDILELHDGSARGADERRLETTRCNRDSRSNPDRRQFPVGGANPGILDKLCIFIGRQERCHAVGYVD